MSQYLLSAEEEYAPYNKPLKVIIQKVIVNKYSDNILESIYKNCPGLKKYNINKYSIMIVSTTIIKNKTVLLGYTCSEDMSDRGIKDFDFQSLVADSKFYQNAKKELEGNVLIIIHFRKITNMLA